MNKPKAVTHSVAAKKRAVPSLLRTANNRIQTKRGSHHAPPIETIEPKVSERISDLTEPVYEQKRDPPLHEIHSAYQSTASSLTQPSNLRSSTDDDDMEHPKYSNLVYPESPGLRKGQRSISIPNPIELDKIVLKRSESDIMSQQYLVKKRNLVVGIPIENDDSDLQQQVSPGTDAAIAEKTPKQTAASPTTNESVNFASTKSGMSKPSRKIGFKAVKALISRVHSGSPRKRSSPTKSSKKKATTELSQIEQSLLLASNPRVEETVSGIPVKFQSSTRHPVIHPTYSYRDTARLEPPALTETRSSNDPSPKQTHFFDDGPPDLTETKESSEDISVELRSPEKPSSHGKSLEPPEFDRPEIPRAGSPELRRGDVSPVLAKSSRLRGLEPDAVVAFGERQPVDAPEKSSTTIGPLNIVGIPVDTDEISELDDGTHAKSYAERQKSDPRGPSDSGSVESPRATNPFDSASENANPISARVVRARRSSKPINPFDSSSGNSSVGLHLNTDGLKTNPFESSDSGDVDDDDPFDRILSENMVDSLSDDDDCIPPPKKISPAAKSKGTTSTQSRPISTTAPSPLREQNRGSQPKETRKKKSQKAAIPMPEFDVHDDSYVSDLEQSVNDFPVKKIALSRQDADISAMDTTNDAQDTITTKESVSKALLQVHQMNDVALKNASPQVHQIDDVALADSISDGSGHPMGEPVRVGCVMGEIVEDDDSYEEKGISYEGTTTFPEKTPKMSNEALKSSIQNRNKYLLERVKQFGPRYDAEVGLEPSGSRNSSSGRLDRYSLQKTDTTEREDILDRFFTFIHETIRRSPKSRENMQPSIDKLPSEAKLIVEAALEKAREATATKEDLDSFYLDEDIEIAFENIEWSAAKSLQKLMEVHKKAPFSKIKRGGSIASNTETVDASEASELLSELQEYSSVVKGVARRSMKKSLSAGRTAPKWTKQLIDLTGVESFRDLDSDEAVWLFDLNASAETPKSDLVSLMDFAAKRLGFSLDREALLTTALKPNPPISSVGVLTPQTNVTDSPFAAIRKEESTTSKSAFQFDTPAVKHQVTEKRVAADDVLNNACRDAEAILCGEYGAKREQAMIETVESNDSQHKGDKYNVSTDIDKYSEALDDKTFEDSLSEEQFNVGDAKTEYRKPAVAQHSDRDSDVSSSDELSVILAKIKRDIKDAEDSRQTPREGKKESQKPEPPNESSRRDFLDMLFQATGSLFCGAVDIGNHGVYGGMETTPKRKKDTKFNLSHPSEVFEDPFSGLELESPTASEGTGYFSPENASSAKAKSQKIGDFASPKQTSNEHAQNEYRSNEYVHEVPIDPIMATPESSLNIDAFENTGSLLNKGPFSPINEQPSAEEENLQAQEEEDLLSKEQVMSRSHDEDGGQELVDEFESEAGSERNRSDKSDQELVDEFESEAGSERNQSENSETSSADGEQLRQESFDADHYGVNESNPGPKPEHLQRPWNPLQQHSAQRDRPIPEILDLKDRDQRSRYERKSQGGHIATDIQSNGSSGHGDSGSGKSDDVVASQISAQHRIDTETESEQEDNTIYIQPKVLGEDHTAKGVICQKSCEANGPPIPENYNVSPEVAKLSVKMESNLSPSPESHKLVPPSPETHGLVKTEASTSRVSMIRSKFESAVASAPSRESTTVKPEEIFGTPESTSSRFSRISSLRSKFEKKGIGRKDSADSKLERNTINDNSEGGLLNRVTSIIDADEKKEDFPETIDLTNAEPEPIDIDQYEILDVASSESANSESANSESANSNGPNSKGANSEPIEAVVSGDGIDPYEILDVARSESANTKSTNREPIEAVLSGDGTRLESPIFVGDDVCEDELQPIPAEQSPDMMLRSEHIDLVGLDESRDRNLDGDFLVDDGRNSDIAFSLSPSTAASSRVFQSYVQHQLLDALPILAASSSPREPEDVIADSQDQLDGNSESRSSYDISISSTNVEGAKHCDIDPNTIPEEIALNKKSTPRSLIEDHHFPTDLPWGGADDATSCSDGNESSGDESASLLLALTRSEAETEVFGGGEDVARSIEGLNDTSSVGEKLELNENSQQQEPTCGAFQPSCEMEAPARKVSSPLYSSLQKRLGRSFSGTEPDLKEPLDGGEEHETLDAEELFAILDEKKASIIDVTSYTSSRENESVRSSSRSETSCDANSAASNGRPTIVKTNQFLETIMDRLRASPSAKRFASKSINQVSPASSSTEKPAESFFDSIATKLQISEKDSSDIDDLFQRYDNIVKNMVVLDDERLARVQAKQLASIVMAADSAVEHAPNSPRALSEIARRLRKTAAERKMEDKVLAYRGEPIDDTIDSKTIGHGSSSAASDSTHPSSHARQLRRDLQAALDKSAAIRNSQQLLGEEMTSFQERLNERRSLSTGRRRSLPGSPAKSYYHRNCCASSSDGTTSIGNCDLSPLHRDNTAVPRTILTQKSDTTSDDEDIQNRHLESIRSGLRSSVGRSPRARARRRRFRRSQD